jgi:hypothetical protein
METEERLKNWEWIAQSEEDNSMLDGDLKLLFLFQFGYQITTSKD